MPRKPKDKPAGKPDATVRDTAAMAKKLRAVLGGDESRRKRFSRELEGRPDLEAVFLITLLDELRDRELEALADLLALHPAALPGLLGHAKDLEFHACRCILDALREAKLDDATPTRALYDERREDLPDGALIAVHMLETSHPDWVKCVLEQFGRSVDHAAEMAFHLRVYLEDFPDEKKRLEASAEPEVKLVLERYREALDLLADEREGEDVIEFFAETDVAFPDGPVKTFLHEVANSVANTLLAMKEEEELEFLDYSGLRDFTRRLMPGVILLVRDETAEGGLLDNPDDLHEEGLSDDPARERHPELWREFQRYLDEMYGDRDLYRIDAFMWKVVEVVRERVDATPAGMIDAEKRERFVVDLAAAVTGRVEECLSCDRECAFNLGDCPDDPSRLLK